MTALAQHSAATFEWGSPPEILDPGRYVLGGDFDLDPCSSAYWNAAHVRAARFIGAAEDGLRAHWGVRPGMRISCNSPGGWVAEFWRSCKDAWNDGAGVWWIGFSLEQLLYVQRFGFFSSEFSRAILPKRVAWLRGVADQPQQSLFGAAPEVPEPEPVDSPTHGNYLALLPAPGYLGQFQRRRFAEVCADQLGGAEVF